LKIGTRKRDDGLRGRGPAVAAGLVAVLAALTRPDGLIYAVSFPLVALLLAGLTDARIADYRGAGDIHGLAGYLFGTVRPALINAVRAWRITGWTPTTSRST
jgi:hypothetical protein